SFISSLLTVPPSARGSGLYVPCRNTEETRSAMSAHRSKLLIPLFLLVAALCTGWSSVYAMPRTNDIVARTHVIDSKPNTRPYSGEPDVGSTKLPPKGTLVPVSGTGDVALASHSA